MPPDIGRFHGAHSVVFASCALGSIRMGSAPLFGRDVRGSGGSPRERLPDALFAQADAVLLDLDGVLYVQDELVPGARDAVAALVRRALQVNGTGAAGSVRQATDHVAWPARLCGSCVRAMLSA
jgi:hypothetical protein